MRPTGPHGNGEKSACRQRDRAVREMSAVRARLRGAAKRISRWSTSACGRKSAAGYLASPAPVVPHANASLPLPIVIGKPTRMLGVCRTPQGGPSGLPLRTRPTRLETQHGKRRSPAPPGAVSAVRSISRRRRGSRSRRVTHACQEWSKADLNSFTNRHGSADRDLRVAFRPTAAAGRRFNPPTR